jgi:hypothetical protein
MYPSEITYEVRCSIWHFHKYLLDLQEIALQLVDKTGKNLGLAIIKLNYLIKDT